MSAFLLFFPYFLFSFFLICIWFLRFLHEVSHTGSFFRMFLSHSFFVLPFLGFVLLLIFSPWFFMWEGRGIRSVCVCVWGGGGGGDVIYACIRLARRGYRWRWLIRYYLKQFSRCLYIKIPSVVFDGLEDLVNWYSSPSPPSTFILWDCVQMIQSVPQPFQFPNISNATATDNKSNFVAFCCLKQ